MAKTPLEDQDDREGRPRSRPPALPDEGIREGQAPTRESEGDQPTRSPRPRHDDDRPRRRSRRDDDVMSSLIPYKNGLALAAYYCGVFSLIPCAGMVLAVASVILGILGLNQARRYPEVKGGGHAIAGIVLGAVSLLGHGVVVLLLLLSRKW